MSNINRKKWIPWVMVLPVLLIRLFTTVYPIGMTFRNSLFSIKLLSGINKFVGMRNYVDVFKDDKVIASLTFTVIFVFFSMFFHIILGIGLADRKSVV